MVLEVRLFFALISSTVVPKRIARPHSVSPVATTYSNPSSVVGVAVAPGSAVAVGSAVVVGLASGEVVDVIEGRAVGDPSGAGVVLGVVSATTMVRPVEGVCPVGTAVPAVMSIVAAGGSFDLVHAVKPRRTINEIHIAMVTVNLRIAFLLLHCAVTGKDGPRQPSPTLADRPRRRPRPRSAGSKTLNSRMRTNA